MSDVAVVIRLCYFPGAVEDERRWRFRFFDRIALPYIQRQTVPVDTWVWVHERHEEEARAIFAPYEGVHVFTVDTSVPSREFEETTIRGYPWSAVRGMPRYPYQVLFGSDDIIGPTFVAESIDELDKIRTARALVTHHPIMLDWKTQRFYAMRQWPHRPSPFVVLRQPVGPGYPYAFIWDLPHTHLHKLTGRLGWRYLPPGNAVMTVHDYNDGTRFDPTLNEIGRPSWL